MKKNILLFTFCFSFATLLLAQPGALDLTFAGTGAGDHVRNVAVQPDGRIILAGDFLYYNDLAINRIARVLPNSDADTSFYYGNGTDAIIYALALQPDGKIIIGGDFHDYNGTAINRIARLNTNGTIDTSFHAGTGADNSVKVVCIQPDGKILLGGNFLHYNGTACTRLLRLNTNGTIDNTFNPGNSANGTVECIAVQYDGKILVGGSFTNFNGVNDIRIARINSNGTVDSTFNQGFGGTNSTVTAIAFQNDSNIIIGGNFTTYNLQSLNRIARLSPIGDPNNNFFEGTAANSSIQALKVDEAGYIYIGGSFTLYDGTTINRMARLTPQGRIDSTFNVGFAGCDGDISTIAFQPDGKIVIGGNFLTYNDSARHRIARLYNCLTPQPDSVHGINYALCNGTQQTYFVPPVTGATKYEWTLPNGWLGSSDSTSIIATSTGTGGIISVKAFTDSCGWSYATTRAISTIQPPGVNICLVTVDTQSTHNIVVWEKPVTTLIDSFFIYREITSNTYVKIASVPFDSFSAYDDYGANPNTTSYRYKLSVLDTCGAESNLSDFHNTIHLQNLGSGNFQWTFYQIEPGTNPVTSFNVYRDNNNTGNFSQIGFVPGTNSTFTDVNFFSFPNSVYVVDANWNISCTPTRAVNTTRSNKRHASAIDYLGIFSATENDIPVEVFPNPANTQVTIRLPQNIPINKIELINLLGKAVSTPYFKRGAESGVAISVTGFPKGIYTLSIETATSRVLKKLIIQ